MQLHIELRSLAQSRLDTANLGNLGADMEMYQAQAVAHVFFVQHVKGIQ